METELATLIIKRQTISLTMDKDSMDWKQLGRWVKGAGTINGRGRGDQGVIVCDKL